MQDEFFGMSFEANIKCTYYYVYFNEASVYFNEHILYAAVEVMNSGGFYTPALLRTLSADC